MVSEFSTTRIRVLGVCSAVRSGDCSERFSFRPAGECEEAGLGFCWIEMEMVPGRVMGFFLEGIGVPLSPHLQLLSWLAIAKLLVRFQRREFPSARQIWIKGVRFQSHQVLETCCLFEGGVNAS